MVTNDSSTREWGALRDTAHDGIRDAILNGDLSPGEHMDPHRLEGRIGVPADAIHDAMTALHAEGLLVRDDKAGQFHVIDPDPATVGDTLRTIGVLLGGAVRQTIPALEPSGKGELLDAVTRAGVLATRKAPRPHAQAVLEVYATVLKHCPNPVLADLTRSSLVPLSYHYLVTIDQRELDWAPIISSWFELRDAVTASDQIRGELAIEALHGLPVRSPLAGS